RLCLLAATSAASKGNAADTASKEEAFAPHELNGVRHSRLSQALRDRWAERGEITLDAAAQIIGVAKMTALRMIRTGHLNGRQACKGAPWVIKAEDVAAFGARKRSTGPVTPNPAQQTLAFQ